MPLSARMSFGMADDPTAARRIPPTLGASFVGGSFASPAPASRTDGFRRSSHLSTSMPPPLPQIASLRNACSTSEADTLLERRRSHVSEGPSLVAQVRQHVVHFDDAVTSDATLSPSQSSARRYDSNAERTLLPTEQHQPMAQFYLSHQVEHRAGTSLRCTPSHASGTMIPMPSPISAPSLSFISSSHASSVVRAPSTQHTTATTSGTLLLDAVTVPAREPRMDASSAFTSQLLSFSFPVDEAGSSVHDEPHAGGSRGDAVTDARNYFDDVSMSAEMAPDSTRHQAVMRSDFADPASVSNSPCVENKSSDRSLDTQRTSNLSHRVSTAAGMHQELPMSSLIATHHSPTPVVPAARSSFADTGMTPAATMSSPSAAEVRIMMAEERTHRSPMRLIGDTRLDPFDFPQTPIQNSTETQRMRHHATSGSSYTRHLVDTAPLPHAPRDPNSAFMLQSHKAAMHRLQLAPETNATLRLGLDLERRSRLSNVHVGRLHAQNTADAVRRAAYASIRMERLIDTLVRDESTVRIAISAEVMEQMAQLQWKFFVQRRQLLCAQLEEAEVRRRRDIEVAASGDFISMSEACTRNRNTAEVLERLGQLMMELCRVEEPKSRRGIFERELQTRASIGMLEQISHCAVLESDTRVTLEASSRHQFALLCRSATEDAASATSVQQQREFLERVLALMAEESMHRRTVGAAALAEGVVLASCHTDQLGVMQQEQEARCLLEGDERHLLLAWWEAFQRDAVSALHCYIEREESAIRRRLLNEMDAAAEALQESETASRMAIGSLLHQRNESLLHHFVAQQQCLAHDAVDVAASVAKEEAQEWDMVTAAYRDACKTLALSMSLQRLRDEEPIARRQCVADAEARDWDQLKLEAEFSKSLAELLQQERQTRETTLATEANVWHYEMLEIAKMEAEAALARQRTREALDAEARSQRAFREKALSSQPFLGFGLAERSASPGASLRLTPAPGPNHSYAVLVVDSLVVGGPAHASGMRLHDRIVSMDGGKPPTSLVAMRQAIARGAAVGRAFEVVVKRKSKKVKRADAMNAISDMASDSDDEEQAEPVSPFCGAAAARDFEGDLSSTCSTVSSVSSSSPFLSSSLREGHTFSGAEREKVVETVTLRIPVKTIQVEFQCFADLYFDVAGTRRVERRPRSSADRSDEGSQDGSTAASAARRRSRAYSSIVQSTSVATPSKPAQPSLLITAASTTSRDTMISAPLLNDSRKPRRKTVVVLAPALHSQPESSPISGDLPPETTITRSPSPELSPPSSDGEATANRSTPPTNSQLSPESPAPNLQGAARPRRPSFATSFLTQQQTSAPSAAGVAESAAQQRRRRSYTSTSVTPGGNSRPSTGH